MPPKKRNLSDVVAATSDGRNMKLHSPRTRRPAKIHTSEPVVKKKDQPAKSLKKPSATVTTPKKKAGALTEANKNKAPVKGNVTVPNPISDDVVPDLVNSPKKKTVSVQTILCRSLRCSTKLRVEKPSKTDPKKALQYPVSESDTKPECPRLVPMVVDPPAASKYPTRTVSSSHQTNNRYPSLTPSHAVSENPPVQTHTNPSNEEPPANPSIEVLNESPNEEPPANPSNEEPPANPFAVPNGGDYTDENIQEVEELPLSIRYTKQWNSSEEDGNVSEGETSKMRKRRGVVCGTKIATLVKSLGTRIKIDCSEEANDPVIKEIRSILCHQIRACVRQKMPMLAPTYSELEP